MSACTVAVSSQLLYLETRVQASHQAYGSQTDVAQLLRGVQSPVGRAVVVHTWRW